MDSPGGTTPRSTPVRMTPIPNPRGQHHGRVSQPHSSCLLEDVLAEKKMALMQSPEVIQWLQDFQQQVKTNSISPDKSDEPLATGDAPGEQSQASGISEVTTATYTEDIGQRSGGHHHGEEYTGIPTQRPLTLSQEQLIQQMSNDIVYQMSDPSKARLVTQWLNDNVHQMRTIQQGQVSHETQPHVSQQINPGLSMDNQSMPFLQSHPDKL